MLNHFNVTQDYLLNPIHLLLLVSLASAIFAYLQGSRRKLLIYKLIADLLFGVYLIMLGGLAGGFSALIAVTGGFIQILTPDEKMKATAGARIALAVILSGIVVYVGVNRGSDLLPVIAVVYSRFAELGSSRQLIAICMLLAGVAWLCYNFTNGFLFAFIYNIITISFMAYGIHRHRKII